VSPFNIYIFSVSFLLEAPLFEKNRLKTFVKLGEDINNANTPGVFWNWLSNENPMHPDLILPFEEKLRNGRMSASNLRTACRTKVHHLRVAASLQHLFPFITNASMQSPVRKGYVIYKLYYAKLIYYVNITPFQQNGQFCYVTTYDFNVALLKNFGAGERKNKWHGVVTPRGKSLIIPLTCISINYVSKIINIYLPLQSNS
jgi:hypothetical protein